MRKLAWRDGGRNLVRVSRLCARIRKALVFGRAMARFYMIGGLNIELDSPDSKSVDVE